MSSRPTLHLTVGLPGVGKTTLARELERASAALRLTPDEWMVPLFGVRWADFGGKRDVLEGRLIWVAHQVLRAGGSVILDFGCWSSDERYALRAIADLAGADFELHYLTLPEDAQNASDGAAPLLLGTGKRLFRDLPCPRRLQMLDSGRIRLGTVTASYRVMRT